jgi:putative ABC transport system permease protein
MLTLSGSAVALFVFCMVMSVQEGLEDVMQQDQTVLVAFQKNKYCPATSHLPQDYEHHIRRLEGVVDVLPIQVLTNNCRASLDVVVFYGTIAKKVRERREFDLVAGSWEEFEGNQDAGLVGQTLAKRRKLKLGDKFSVGDVTVTIAGIFSSSNRSEENYVYCHLDFLQRTRGMDLVGTVTQHEVFLADSKYAQSVSQAIDRHYRAGPVETDTRPKGVFQASTLADLFQLVALSRYLGYACLALVVVLLSTTTIMSVEDRIAEHAVLQTLGFTSQRVFRMVLTECLLLGVAGGLLGTGMALIVLATSGFSLGTQAVAVAFVPSLRLVATAIVTAVAVGVAAGIAPAWRAAMAPIVPALRHLG